MIDLTGYSDTEIKTIASKLAKDYGPFVIRGAEVLFEENGQLTKADIEDKILTLLKEKAINTIESRAEAIRGTILTPGSGQGIEYAFKYVEASEILSRPLDEELDPNRYIMLANELQLHSDKAMSLRQLASFVMDRVIDTKKKLSTIAVQKYTFRNRILAAKTKPEVDKIVTDARYQV